VIVQKEIFSFHLKVFSDRPGLQLNLSFFVMPLVRPDWHSPGQTVIRQARLAGGRIMFSACLSVRPFICLLPNCEHDILKTNEPILMQIGIRGPRSNPCKNMKRWGIRRSKLKEDRFGDLAEASFLTPSGRLVFSS